jgi:MbtH protein
MFDDGGEFKVVCNGEGQYSIWPAGRMCPAGWQEEGTRGSRDACLVRIGLVWTDMRPASLRDVLGEAG